MQMRPQLLAILLLTSWAFFVSPASANQTAQQFANIGCKPVGNPESQILKDQSLVVRALCQNGHAAVIFAKNKSMQPVARDCGTAPPEYPVLSGDGASLQMQPCIAWRPVTHFMPNGKGGQTAIPGPTKLTANLPKNDGKIILPPTVPVEPPVQKPSSGGPEEILQLDPRITSALDKQKCIIEKTGMVFTMGIPGENMTMVGVTCKDGRAMAAQLLNGKTEVKTCTTGQKNVTFPDGTKGDYCPG